MACSPRERFHRKKANVNKCFLMDSIAEFDGIRTTKQSVDSSVVDEYVTEEYENQNEKLACRGATLLETCNAQVDFV